MANTKSNRKSEAAMLRKSLNKLVDKGVVRVYSDDNIPEKRSTYFIDSSRPDVSATIIIQDDGGVKIYNKDLSIELGQGAKYAGTIAGLYLGNKAGNALEDYIPARSTGRKSNKRDTKILSQSQLDRMMRN